MLDIALSAIGTVMTGPHLFFMTIGILVGLVVGILPGLGGIAGMSILLPFIYSMEPASALGMLIGMVAVIPTGDTFTSVMMGIPGSSASQATIMDGFPLAKQGQAARALSAAFLSSMIGGIFGALILSLAVVIARPLILSFSSAELFAVTVFGLSMVATLSGRSLAKGLAASGLGLAIGSVGAAPATGEFRMTLGIEYLYDGVPLVVVAMGIFALPEIIDLLRKGRAIAEHYSVGGGWWRGLRDVWKNMWLVLRCSGIGCLIGALPGLGGSVVDWIAYGHVVQTSKDKTGFGKGEIRGVIAPESANNACQGGALIPTLLFGVPGSGSMAVFLGGMILIGLQPGVTMIDTRLDLTYTIIWTLALANIVGAGLCVLLTRGVARLTAIRFVYLAPFMIMIVLFAAFQASRNIGDMVALLTICALALLLRRFGWPRPALLVGYVLAPSAETYLYQAVQFYGWNWIVRPGVMVIFLITAVSVFFGLRYESRVSTEGPVKSASERTRRPQIFFAALVSLALAYVIVDAFAVSYLARVFPITVAVITLFGALWVTVTMALGKPGVLYDDNAEQARAGGWWSGSEPYWAMIASAIVSVYLFGFTAGMSLFLFAFLFLFAKAGLMRSLLLTIAGISFILAISEAMTLRLPEGIFSEWLLRKLSAP